MNKLFLASCLLIGVIIAFSNINAHDYTPIKSDEKPSIDSAATFDKMMQVITHKRCVNCHPSGDTPRQGEDSHLHYFGVRRGWGLAPASMAWENKTNIQIASQMMDPTRNGGKNAQEILKHLTEDELVLWAWKPGVNDEGEPRETPPLTKDEWITTVKEWINNGAIIPSE